MLLGILALSVVFVLASSRGWTIHRNERTSTPVPQSKGMEPPQDLLVRPEGSAPLERVANPVSGENDPQPRIQDFPYAHYSDCRDFLRDHWGSDWPAFEKELLDKNARLDVPMDKIPSWDHVFPNVRAELIRSLAEAGDQRKRNWMNGFDSAAALPLTTTAWNPGGKTIDERVRQAAFDLLQDTNVEIEALADELATSVQAIALEKLETGRVVRHPLGTPSFAQPRPLQEDIVTLSMLNVNGWSITVYVLASEIENGERLVQRIRTEIAARAERLRSFIESL